MTTTKRNALMRRWALLSFLAFGLFWSTWYLIKGGVPGFPLDLHLPFTATRWLDVATAPLWATLIVYTAWIWQKAGEGYELDLGFTEGVAGGLAIGLYLGGCLSVMTASPFVGLSTQLLFVPVGMAFVGLMRLTRGVWRLLTTDRCLNLYDRFWVWMTARDINGKRPQLRLVRK